MRTRVFSFDGAAGVFGGRARGDQGAAGGREARGRRREPRREGPGAPGLGGGGDGDGDALGDGRLRRGRRDLRYRRAPAVEQRFGDGGGAGRIGDGGERRADDRGRGAEVGETAATADIEDADGLSGATFAFQWVSVDGGAEADIAGATGASYVLGESDEGAAIKVRASFTDDADHDEELTSGATGTVEPRPLTAEFQGMPAEHDGRRLFTFELVFSENFPGRFRALRSGTARSR